MPSRFPTLIHSPDSPVTRLLRSAARIAQSDATVLLTGETGTGKEVFARVIHQESARRERPIVAVNCGAIPEALLESELFGHARGAFTGAVQSRKGRVALAEGGTLFLDEVGELPLSLQVKLLRLLQERTYEPVGSAESVPANFRLIAATNRDLAQEVAAGRFRADLYFRLHVCPLELPPLRDRAMDIPELLEHFRAQHGDGRPMSADLVEALVRYPWPGNIRELENLVERMSVCSVAQTLTLADLPPSFLSPAPSTAPASPNAPNELTLFHAALPRNVIGLFGAPPTPLPEAQSPAAPPKPPEVPEVPRRFPVDLPRILRELEEQYIAAALVQAGGSKKEAADLLGLQRTTLVEKLRRRKALVAAAG